MDQNPYTTPRLAQALEAEGFICDPGKESGLLLTVADWWEVADEHLNVIARVACTIEDGVDVYAFTGGRACLLAWEARFASSTPVDVIVSAAKAAAVRLVSA